MGKATVKILQPGDEPALEAFLLPRIESSMFLVGNMRAAGLADGGEPYQGTYAAAVEAGEIKAVTAHYWNQILIFQAPAHLDMLWEAAVKESGRPLKGLIGPTEQVEIVKAALNIDATIIQMEETEKLYSLSLESLIVPDSLRLGTVQGRRIEASDVELMTGWRIAYSIETLGAEDTLELRSQCRASIERSLKEKRTWVLEAGGEAVACTSFNTAIKEAVQVGGVWTPPALRGRGYGRAVVAASLLDGRADGAETAILFTGTHNIAAQKAYEALGFQHIGDYQMVLLKTALDLTR